MSQSVQAVNCWQCRHFGITHEALQPYRCGLMGFKSKQLPAWVVKQVDGQSCKGYTPKPPKENRLQA